MGQKLIIDLKLNEKATGYNFTLLDTSNTACRKVPQNENHPTLSTTETRLYNE